jgi:NitT/TauT family transport system permease protein
VFLIHELPTPLESAAALWRLATVGEPVLGRTIWQHASASLGRVLAGSAVAAVLAIPMGLARGRSSRMDDAFIPITEMIRPIPPIAWVPLGSIIFIALTGTVVWVKVFIVFIGAFFPILLNTLYGARSIDPVYLDVARAYRASPAKTWTTVVVPAALPSIITGIRIGLGVAWMSIIAAEMIGGSASGLGYFILAMYTVGGDTPAIVAGMAAIGLIGFAMNELLLLATRRATRWV